MTFLELYETNRKKGPKIILPEHRVARVWGRPGGVSRESYARILDVLYTQAQLRGFPRHVFHKVLLFFSYA